MLRVFTWHNLQFNGNLKWLEHHTVMQLWTETEVDWSKWQQMQTNDGEV